MMFAQTLSIDWNNTLMLLLAVIGVVSFMVWIAQAPAPVLKDEKETSPLRPVEPQKTDPKELEPDEFVDPAESYLRFAPDGFCNHVARILAACPGAPESIQMSYIKRGLREIDVLREELNRLTVAEGPKEVTS